eukprot:354267-Chlamydomonas_euryale.AAC.7
MMIDSDSDRGSCMRRESHPLPPRFAPGRGRATGGAPRGLPKAAMATAAATAGVRVLTRRACGAAAAPIRLPRRRGVCAFLRRGAAPRAHAVWRV